MGSTKKKASPKKITSIDLPLELEVGTLVRFRKGDTGTYRIHRTTPCPDKTILLYGGDTDPMGYRRYRNGLRDDLQLEDRNDVLSKRRRET